MVPIANWVVDRTMNCFLNLINEYPTDFNSTITENIHKI